MSKRITMVTPPPVNDIEVFEIPDTPTPQTAADVLNQTPQNASSTSFEVVELNTESDKVEATECEFKVNTKEFFTFLETISLNGSVTDCYIKVGSKVRSTYSYGGDRIIGYTTLDNAEVKSPGSFIVAPSLDKFKKIIKAFASETMTISYKDNFIHLSGGKAKAKLLGHAVGNVNSYVDLQDGGIDIANGHIDDLGYFKDMPTFPITQDVLNNMCNVGKSVALEYLTLVIKKGKVKIESTSTFDEYSIEIENVPKGLPDIETMIFLSDVERISKGLGKGNVTVTLNENLVIFTVNDQDYYMIQTFGTD